MREQTLERAKLNIQKGVSDYLYNKGVKDTETTGVSKNEEFENNISSKNRFKLFEIKLRKGLNRFIEENPKLKVNVERLREVSKSNDEDWNTKCVLRVA